MHKKIDSMWWHESPENGPLASSHIAVVFCALVKSEMIVKDLLSLEFEGIPKDFSDRSLSPMDYCLAYTDGELFDHYVKARYREAITILFDGNKIYDLIMDEKLLSHTTGGSSSYTLECTWGNVDALANWLQQNIVTGNPLNTLTNQNTAKRKYTTNTVLAIIVTIVLFIISVITLFITD